MPPANRQSSRRPQTRAWVKAQKDLLQPTTAGVDLSRNQDNQPETTRSAVKKRQRDPNRDQTSRRSTQHVPSKTVSAGAERITRGFQARKSSNQQINKQPERRTRYLSQSNQDNIRTREEDSLEITHEAEEVPNWLRQVRSVSPQRAFQEQTLYTSAVPGVALGEMDSSSASREGKDNESTIKIPLVKTSKLTDTKLKYRRVQRVKAEDERLPYLRSFLRTSFPERSMRDIPDLGAIAQEFIGNIEARESESCYTFVDEFSLKFDEGKARMNYPIINSAYFDDQLKKCLSKNEAVLQRTVMMSVFHHYWLRSVFDWNAEGQWALPKDVRLPSREDDDITLPKPDLEISFTLRSFTGEEDDSDPIPPDLEKCISPDGGDRCFPFLFMEVKKAAADLQEAQLANLHTASQALYNIYLWMARTGKERSFFDHVRVFSFVFNAQDLSVRIHRASRLSDGNLSFRFDDFLAVSRYTRDTVCLLVDTILNDYAAGELHGILQEAFREVVVQEVERVLSKRKASAARSTSSKRMRRSDGASEHTGQSFGMSQLQT